MTTGRSTKRAPSLPPEERRAAIVAATMPLFVEFGEHVTTRQIADAAGIAEGTIFRVFADKAELLLATLECVLDQAPLDEALGSINPDLDLQATLVEATTLIQQRITDVWSLLSGLGPDLRSRVARPLQDHGALEAVLARHSSHFSVAPIDAAQLLRGLTISLTHPMMARSAMRPTDIVDFFLHGASAPANR